MSLHAPPDASAWARLLREPGAAPGSLRARYGGVDLRLRRSAGHVLGARLITGGSFAGLAVRGSRFALTGTGDLDPLDLGAGPAQATGHVRTRVLRRHHVWVATYAP
jgi:hypothetical protein